MTLSPDLNVLLRGIRQTLEDEILPELQSAYVRSRLRIAIKVVDVVSARWERLSMFVFDENESYRSLLQGVRESLLRDSISDATLGQLAADISAGLETHGTMRRPATLGELTVENQSLRALVSVVLARLDRADWTAISVSEEIRASVAQHLVVQLSRERDVLPALPWEEPEKVPSQ